MHLYFACSGVAQHSMLSIRKESWWQYCNRSGWPADLQSKQSSPAQTPLELRGPGGAAQQA